MICRSGGTAATIVVGDAAGTWRTARRQSGSLASPVYRDPRRRWGCAGHCWPVYQATGRVAAADCAAA